MQQVRYGFISILVVLEYLYHTIAKEEGGSQLFGIEPWTFYVKNLFVNFNIIFVFAIPAIIVGLFINLKEIVVLIMFHRLLSYLRNMILV